MVTMIPRSVRLLPALLAPLALLGPAIAQETPPPNSPPTSPPTTGPGPGTAPATRTPPAPPPVVQMRTTDRGDRVIQGAEDVGPLSTAQWIDLRQDVDGGFGFGSVYRDGDLFMRSLGALRAVFPRSEYMSPRVGLSSASVPAGTQFQIGEPLRSPEWQARPDMRNGRAPSLLVPGGPLAIAPANPEAGAVRVDPFSRGRVIGTGLANDPVILRQLFGRDTPVPSRSVEVDENGRPLAEADRVERTANRPSDDSLPGRPQAGAASPPRLTPMPMPAIVDDREYRRSRLRAILDRALAGARSTR